MSDATDPTAPAPDPAGTEASPPPPPPPKPKPVSSLADLYALTVGPPAAAPAPSPVAPPASPVAPSVVPADARAGLAALFAASAPAPDSHVTPTAQSAAAESGDAPTATGAGAPTTPSAETDADRGAGSRLGRYTLLSALGAGGMGVVWKARDAEIDRVVALKEIKPGVANDVQLARFQREARLSARLRHPHIVAVHDAGTVDGRHYIAMDYVEGRTLRAFLAETRDAKRDGATPDPARLRVEIEALTVAAEAVDYAHAQGILHRDLKPDNVLIDRAGRPYVMDFGIARLVELEGAGDSVDLQKLTRSGQMLGTASYMSPEQVNADDAAIGPRSDVWALGAMLFELLTGRQPFTKDSSFATVLAVLKDEPVRPRKTNPGVPEELEAACLGALEKEIPRRTPSAGEFAADLRRWLRGEPVHARAHTWRVRAARALRRRRVPMALASAAVLLVALALGVIAHLRTQRTVRFHAALDAIVAEVREFEDQLWRVGPPQGVRAELARQSLDLIKPLIDEQSRFGPAYAWRARVHDLLGETREAEEDLEKACALAPDSPAPLFVRGLRAIEAYVAARGLPATSAVALEHRFLPMRAETDQERLWREQGRADLERLGSLPASADALPAEEARMVQGLLALHAGDADGYARVLRELADIPGPRAARLRGIALYFQRSFREAVAAFDLVLEEWPFHAQSWLHRALAHEGVAQGNGPIERDSSHWVQAIDDLTEAIRLDPDSAAAYVARGRVRHTQGDSLDDSNRDPWNTWLDSARDFDSAIERAPDDPLIRVGRARVARALADNHRGLAADPDRWERLAFDDLARALATAPDLAQAYQERQYLHRHAAWQAARAGGDPEPHWQAALADLDQAIGLEPDQPVCYHERGTLHLDHARELRRRGQDARDEYRRGIADIDAALARSPERMWMRQNRGSAWAELAEVEQAHGNDGSASLRKAEDDFRAAVEQGEPWCWGNLAQHFAKQGRWTDAFAAVRRFGAEVRQNRPAARGLMRTILDGLAQDEEKQGRDGDAALRAIVAGLDAEIPAAPRNAALCDRAIVQSTRGLLLHKKKQDACDAFRRSAEDFTQALAEDERPEFLRLERGRSWSDLGKAQVAVGQDPAESFRRAEEDFRFASQEGVLPGTFELAQLLNDLQRHDEARQEIAALLEQVPALREDALPLLQVALRGLWLQALDRARTRVKAGDYAGAHPEFEAAFARLAEEIATLPESERERAFADPWLRGNLADAFYNAACVEAVLSLGMAGPAAQPGAIDPETARGHRERALDHLAASVRHGFTDLAHMRADPDLAALHADPRFAEISGQGK